MHRIVSLLPAATEIAAALGLMDNVVGVSHECDFPDEANVRPRVTRCPVHNRGLTSKEVDEWVRRALRENGTIYTIDERLLRELRPDVILAQKLCDVCAVGYGTVARLAETLPNQPRVVSLEPSSLSDIFGDIRRVAGVCGAINGAETLIATLSTRVESVRERAAKIPHRPRCFVLEWIDPPFCSGHWVPELVEIAGGHDPLGRKHQPSSEIRWEEVVKAQPNIIVVALCGYDIERARRDCELLRRFPGFDSIPAAQNGEIYLVNASAYFARPGPRIVDTLEILAGILHPEEFSRFTRVNLEDHRTLKLGMHLKRAENISEAHGVGGISKAN
ncbi:MAG TPA: cobalamin-binding protein [Verrucomicrobiae bacterium]|nr:cobalamin-binding protein [Verrucomicrobiae bacterium]